MAKRKHALKSGRTERPLETENCAYDAMEISGPGWQGYEELLHGSWG